MIHRLPMPVAILALLYCCATLAVAWAADMPAEPPHRGEGLYLSVPQLISVVGSLAAVIVALFWQLLKALGGQAEAYRETLPLAWACQRILDRCQACKAYRRSDSQE